MMSKFLDDLTNASFEENKTIDLKIRAIDSWKEFKISSVRKIASRIKARTSGLINRLEEFLKGMEEVENYKIVDEASLLQLEMNRVSLNKESLLDPVNKLSKEATYFEVLRFLLSHEYICDNKMNDGMLFTPVEELELSARIKNSLYKNEIITMHDLVVAVALYDAQKLAMLAPVSIRGLGKTSMDEIKNVLKEVVEKC